MFPLQRKSQKNWWHNAKIIDHLNIIFCYSEVSLFQKSSVLHIYIERDRKRETISVLAFYQVLDDKYILTFKNYLQPLFFSVGLFVRPMTLFTDREMLTTSRQEVMYRGHVVRHSALYGSPTPAGNRKGDFKVFSTR